MIRLNIFQRMAGGVLLLALLGGFLYVPPANAVYVPLLDEDWEYSIGTTLPVQSWGNTWNVWPYPFPTHWELEFNAVYHPGQDDEVMSIWCAGSDNTLQAGIDYYTNNILTYVYWGPFSISAANQHPDGEAFGGFWLWSEMEPNGDNSGDFTYLCVKQGPFSSNITSWDYLYKNDQGGNGAQWQQVNFNFDQVITAAGDTISYLDEGITSNLYIAFAFDSDGNQNDFRGTFIDDVTMGYEDGLFDFDYRGFELFDPDTGEDFDDNIMYVNTPVGVRVKFKCFGNTLSNQVDHVLYNVQNQPISTISGQWQGGTIGVLYEEDFPDIFTPQQEGELQISFYLDPYNDQPESDENNNDSELITIPIYAENTEPSMNWINPDGETFTSGQTFDIIWEAFNEPVQENSRISLYFDYDNEGFNGYSIQGGSNRPITNSPDTLTWNIGQLQYDEYWLYARLTDDVHEPVYLYADGPVIYGSAVEDGPDSALPEAFSIENVYPNPFNPTVEVTLNMPATGEVEAVWYAVDGREVARQELGSMNAGQQRFSWTPDNLTSGVYLLRVHSPFGIATQKVTYLK